MNNARHNMGMRAEAIIRDAENSWAWYKYPPRPASRMWYNGKLEVSKTQEIGKEDRKQRRSGDCHRNNE